MARLACVSGCGSDSQGWHKAPCLVPAPQRLDSSHAEAAANGALLPGECWQHVLQAALPALASSLLGLRDICAQVEPIQDQIYLQHQILHAPVSVRANTPLILRTCQGAVRSLFVVLKVTACAVTGGMGAARGNPARLESSWMHRLP